MESSYADEPDFETSLLRVRRAGNTVGEWLASRRVDIVRATTMLGGAALTSLHACLVIADLLVALLQDDGTCSVTMTWLRFFLPADLVFLCFHALEVGRSDPLTLFSTAYLLPTWLHLYSYAAVRPTPRSRLRSNMRTEAMGIAGLWSKGGTTMSAVLVAAGLGLGIACVVHLERLNDHLVLIAGARYMRVVLVHHIALARGKDVKKRWRALQLVRDQPDQAPLRWRDGKRLRLDPPLAAGGKHIFISHVWRFAQDTAGTVNGRLHTLDVGCLTFLDVNNLDRFVRRRHPSVAIMTRGH